MLGRPGMISEAAPLRLQIWICERNIERYLRRLDDDGFAREREMLLELLELEEKKLGELQSRRSKEPRANKDI